MPLRQAAAAREEAAREIASAREMANRAEQIGNVLAAPDLIRYSLSAGTGAPRRLGPGVVEPHSRLCVQRISAATPSAEWLAPGVAPDASGTG